MKELNLKDVCYIVCTEPGTEYSYAIIMKNGLKVSSIVTELLSRYMIQGIRIFVQTSLSPHHKYEILESPEELFDILERK